MVFLVSQASKCFWLAIWSYQFLLSKYTQGKAFSLFIFVFARETQAEGALTLQMNLLGLAGGLIQLSRKCLRYVYYTTNKNIHAISHAKLYVIPQLKSSRGNEAEAIQPCSEPPKSFQRLG